MAQEAYAYQLQALKIQGEIETMQANLTKKRYNILEFERQKQDLIKEIEHTKAQMAAKEQQMADLVAAHGPIPTDLP